MKVFIVFHTDATLALLALKIPKGDRPSCKEIDQTKAEGLRELVGLMKRCWDGDPSQRPDFGGMCSLPVLNTLY